MADPTGARVDPTAVSPGAGRRGLFAGVVVVGLLVAFVAAGRFGATGNPKPTPEPTARATTRDGRATPVPKPTSLSVAPPVALGPTVTDAPSSVPAQTTGVFPTQPVYADPHLGIRVERAFTPGETVSAPTRRTIAFSYSRLSTASPGPGTITVSVGTQAQGADIGTLSPGRIVYGASLDALLGDFLSKARPEVNSVDDAAVSGEPAHVLALMLPSVGDRLVALVSHEGRAYVVAADGFDMGTPSRTSDARRVALLDFLGRISFVAP